MNGSDDVTSGRSPWKPVQFAHSLPSVTLTGDAAVQRMDQPGSPGQDGMEHSPLPTRGGSKVARGRSLRCDLGSVCFHGK